MRFRRNECKIPVRSRMAVQRPETLEIDAVRYEVNRVS